MKGIQYIIDETGEKTAVVIDLEQWGELWDEFFQYLLDRSPDKENWIHQAPFREKLDRAIAWNADHPPRPSDLESLKVQLENHE